MSDYTLFDTSQYESWVKIEDHANLFLRDLYYYASLIVVDDVDNVKAKNTLVFDTGHSQNMDT